jgi:hypothetical protein
MSRRQGEYWRANASHDVLSDNLKAVITCWFQGGELDAEVVRLGIDRYYAPLSWHCLLAGYGQFPEPTRLKPPEPGLPLADMTRIDWFIAGCAQNFPSHDALLARLEEA